MHLNYSAQLKEKHTYSVEEFNTSQALVRAQVEPAASRRLLRVVDLVGPIGRMPASAPLTL
jgi:hypothetical protein